MTTAPSWPKSGSEALKTIDRLVDRGALDATDRALADLMARRGAGATGDVLMAVAVVSAALRDGATCVRLADRVARPLVDRDGRVAVAVATHVVGDRDDASDAPPTRSVDAGLAPEATWPDPTDWADAVRRALAAPGDVAPLVIDGDRVAFQRYDALEQTVADRLAQLASSTPEVATGGPVDVAVLGEAVDAVRYDDEGASEALVAVATAALRGLCVLTGGPGTGKTTAVARMLEVLQRCGVWADPRRVRLLAPTGKAAARIAESLTETWADRIAAHDPAVDGLERDHPLLGTRHQAMTIHKALGVQPGRANRHGASNPLGVDLVIVDEVSMVDLPLMSALLDALPDGARLVLVGDPNQLASVEVGTVLRDVRDAGRGAVSSAWADTLCDLFGEAARDTVVAGRPVVSSATVFGDAHVELTHTWRFGRTIRALAESVLRAGQGGVDVDDVVQLVQGATRPDALLIRMGLAASTHDEAGDGGQIEWIALDPQVKTLPREVRDHLVASLQPAVEAAMAAPSASDDRASTRDAAPDSAMPTDPDADADGFATVREAFAALGHARALCATRRGPLGLEGVSESIVNGLKHTLGPSGFAPKAETLYPGLPVLVTRNDYEAERMNGDLGVCVASRTDADLVHAWFAVPRADGPASRGDRPYTAGALPPWEPAWALTIHKSQGSQFDHVTVVLPPDATHALLSRELLYTAITRAKSKVTLVATPDALRAAIRTRVQRAGGLAERLG